jgi:folate-binding protein YgfZ
MTGYEELRERAAWFPLPGRGKLRITGEDRARLIHAMSTHHVEGLAPGEGVYAFFLNAQGRVLADANIFALEDALLIDCEASARARLYEHIDRYIIADDAYVEDATDKLPTLAVEGPAAGEVVNGLGLPLPASPWAIAGWSGGFVAGVARAARTGYRIFGAAPDLSGIPEADEAAVEAVRLENGRPVYGIDFSEANIAHETGQMHAIHFSKGCYLGQEIVERVRSRGHVNRQLVPLRIETTDAPARGAKVRDGDRDAGEITSAAFSPALNAVCALGIVRTEALSKALSVEGAPARAQV